MPNNDDYHEAELPFWHRDFKLTNSLLVTSRAPESPLVAQIGELERKADHLDSIKATLVVNCEEGRALRDLGFRYDESKSVHSNLIGILEGLVEKAKSNGS